MSTRNVASAPIERKRLPLHKFMMAAVTILTIVAGSQAITRDASAGYAACIAHTYYKLKKLDDRDDKFLVATARHLCRRR